MVPCHPPDPRNPTAPDRPRTLTGPRRAPISSNNLAGSGIRTTGYQKCMQVDRKMPHEINTMRRRQPQGKGIGTYGQRGRQLGKDVLPGPRARRGRRHTPLGAMPRRTTLTSGSGRTIPRKIRGEKGQRKRTGSRMTPVRSGQSYLKREITSIGPTARRSGAASEIPSPGTHTRARVTGSPTASLRLPCPILPPTTSRWNYCGELRRELRTLMSIRRRVLMVMTAR